MEKVIIRYVIWMLTHHSSATLMDRLQTMLDILNAVPSYDWPDIIQAVCRIDEEDEDACV